MLSQRLLSVRGKDKNSLGKTEKKNFFEVVARVLATVREEGDGIVKRDGRFSRISKLF